MTSGERVWNFQIEEVDGRLLLHRNGSALPVDIVPLGHRRYSLLIGGQSLEIGINGSTDGYTIFSGSSSGQFIVEDADIARIRREVGLEAKSGPMTVMAPMPGMIVGVVCRPGDKVSKGQPLVVMEAMKMENEIKAPGVGTIKAVRVAVGDSVEKNQLLIEFV